MDYDEPSHPCFLAVMIIGTQSAVGRCTGYAATRILDAIGLRSEPPSAALKAELKCARKTAYLTVLWNYDGLEQIGVLLRRQPDGTIGLVAGGLGYDCLQMADGLISPVEITNSITASAHCGLDYGPAQVLRWISEEIAIAEAQRSKSDGVVKIGDLELSRPDDAPLWMPPVVLPAKGGEGNGHA